MLYNIRLIKQDYEYYKYTVFYDYNVSVIIRLNLHKNNLQQNLL